MIIRLICDSHDERSILVDVDGRRRWVRLDWSGDDRDPIYATIGGVRWLYTVGYGLTVAR